MNIGIEVLIVTDTTTGKRGLRVYPYITGTAKQMRMLTAAITIALFVGSITVLSWVSPDPIIEPTVTLWP